MDDNHTTFSYSEECRDPSDSSEDQADYRSAVAALFLVIAVGLTFGLIKWAWEYVNGRS
jgi:hypothetical protein